MGHGTGLGLASVYGSVKGHGGHITVRSEVGRGTTFTIYLPATGAQARKHRLRGARVGARGGRLLMVDDEPLVLNVCARILRKKGFSVLTAEGGHEAVEVYEANKDQIDLVILDLIMPDLAGGETFDRLRRINPAVKVLLSSGYSQEGEAQLILDRGCDGFIQKPFDIDQIIVQIGEILGGGPD
jgi:two-component system cell cycle sensor histidine kinase/response regulator CckA